MWRVVFVFCGLSYASALCAAPWNRHTIDDSSKGADGVRMADVNGDGLLEIATGWEEGGRVCVYLHPGAKKVKDRWPAVTVGTVKSPEDAVFVDFDGDGAIDVISSCEGSTRAAYVHFAPGDRVELLNSEAWRTRPIPALANQQQWMYALPLDVDGRRGIDLVIGSKGKNGSVGWLQSPDNPRDVATWKYHRLRDAGWIMSLEAVDVDGDGDLDVLASDRKGAQRGVFWLEHCGAGVFSERRIGGEDHEVMFLDCADLDGDGRKEVVVAAKPRRVLVLSRPADLRDRWLARTIDLAGNFGNAKAVRVADLDLDGRADLVVSCEGAIGDKSGVAWFTNDAPADAGRCSSSLHDISGPPGTKFDRMELVDLDGDGDLDVVTCEEAENLGVIWYENPTR